MTPFFNSFWAGLSRGSRAGLLIGVLAIAGTTAALAVWALRTDYDVLFADLSPPDAAAMAHELDLMKLPYRLGDDGRTLLVERSAVPSTRLKLMGKDLPLHGAVGFELFNNADFGMTEFAQKINFQRALQGEITRTILSLAEVESARVHIAFPDEGLFKRERNRAKASVTLALKHGQSLRKDQVNGIQRLVAAAVPGIQRDDVTIVSRQGVALTGLESSEDGPIPSSRLDLKRDIEQHLAQKATVVLERAFGPGQAMASVDVTLDMNHVRTTTEDVLTPPAAAGEGPSGVILRERETLRDDPSAGRPLPGGAIQASTTHREVDYQVGRKVQQVVATPGAIVKLQALAILKAPLAPAQADQLKAVLAAAVGASVERGDTVVIQSLVGLATQVDEAAAAPAVPAAARTSAVERPSPPSAASFETGRAQLSGTLAWWAVAAAVAVAAVFWSVKRRFVAKGTNGTLPPLTLQEREASLMQVQSWLAHGPKVGTRPGSHT